MGEGLPNHIFGFKHFLLFSASLYKLLLTNQGVKKKEFQEFHKKQVSPTEQGPQDFPPLPFPGTKPSTPARPVSVPFQVARVQRPPPGTCTGTKG